jgi:hypothetical protein
MKQINQIVYNKNKWRIKVVHPSISAIRIFYDGVFIMDESGLGLKGSLIDYADIPDVPQEVHEAFEFWAYMLDEPIYRKGY